jgi:hypothetical protein
MSFDNIKVLTFANQKYKQSQIRLTFHLNNIGLNNVLNYNESHLPESFIEDNKEFFKFRRGFGYWIWKPFIILTELEKLKEDEILLYLDCGDIPTKLFFEILVEHFKSDTIYLTNMGWNHGQWTKRDCFVYMNCDFPEFYSSVQLEAGVIALKKTDFNIQLLKDWYHYMKVDNLLVDSPNIYGLPNLPNFIEHRHDQSILTNLSLLRKIKNHRLTKETVNCNSN